VGTLNSVKMAILTKCLERCGNTCAATSDVVSHSGNQFRTFSNYTMPNKYIIVVGHTDIECGIITVVTTQSI
jgi:hypothetical protein